MFILYSLIDSLFLEKLEQILSMDCLSILENLFVIFLYRILLYMGIYLRTTSIYVQCIFINPQLIVWCSSWFAQGLESQMKLLLSVCFSWILANNIYELIVKYILRYLSSTSGLCPFVSMMINQSRTDKWMLTCIANGIDSKTSTLGYFTSFAGEEKCNGSKNYKIVSFLSCPEPNT